VNSLLNNEIHKNTRKIFMEKAMNAHNQRRFHIKIFVLLSPNFLFFEKDFLKVNPQAIGIQVLL